ESPRTAVRGHYCHFNSTSQYALSRNACQDWYFDCVSFRFNTGLRFGFSGRRTSAICAWRGVRPPFRTLHFRHAQTMLSQVDTPPWLRGTTWSRLSSAVAKRLPQYWHWLLSRAKMLRRLNFTACLGNLSYSKRRMTRGTWISLLIVRTQSS